MHHSGDRAARNNTRNKRFSILTFEIIQINTEQYVDNGVKNIKCKCPTDRCKTPCPRCPDRGLQGRHDLREGGDLRARHVRAAVRHGGGGPAAGQQHHLRPRLRSLHQVRQTDGQTDRGAGGQTEGQTCLGLQET